MASEQGGGAVTMTAQFGGFLVAGGLTTALDFAVYNLLARQPPGWGRVPANLVSCTVAMVFSFMVNWQFVFHPAGSDWLVRGMRFLVVTATSSYLIQSLVIHALSCRWSGPVRIAQRIAGWLPVVRDWTAEAVARNAVKTASVGVGLLWNFAWYRAWVYG